MDELADAEDVRSQVLDPVDETDVEVERPCVLLGQSTLEFHQTRRFELPRSRVIKVHQRQQAVHFVVHFHLHDSDSVFHIRSFTFR